MPGLISRCAAPLRPSWASLIQFAHARPLASFATVQLILLLAFFLPYLSGDLNFVYRDITSYFEPFARYFAAAWAEGRFPLWNSLLYTGMPQIAVGHPHVLYPFTWLLAGRDFSVSLALYLILHLLIAALACFQLARRTGYGNTAAALGGLAASWNGYMLGMFSNFQLLSAVTWLPVLLLSLECMDETHSLRNLLRFLAVSVSVYLLIAAGSPEVGVPAYGLAWVWLLIRFWHESRRGQWATRLLLRAAALGAGVLLAAPLILPAMEWLSLSMRKYGLPSSVVLAWSTDWLNWVSILCTHPLGAEGDALRLFVRLTRGDDGHSYYLDSPYLSPVVLLLAIWGVFARGWRGKPIALGLLFFFAIFTSGANTPFGPLILKWLPMADVVRYPVKLVIFVLAGIILLAVNGFESLLRRQFSSFSLASAAFFTTICFAAGVVLSRDYERVWPWLRPSPLGGEQFPLKLVIYVNGLLAIHLYLAGLLMLVFLCVLLLHQHRKISARSFAANVFILVGGPLLLSAFVFERHGSSQPTFSTPNIVADYARNPANGFDRSQHRYLVPLDHDSFMVPAEVRKRLGAALGSGDRYVATLGLHNTPLVYGLPSSHGYESAALNDFRVLLHQSVIRSGLTLATEDAQPRTDRALARFAALTASRLILESGVASGSPPALEGKLFRVVWHDEDLHARLYEPTAIRPRWYWTRQAECVSQPNDFLNILLDPQPNAFDGPTRAAYVVKAEAGSAAPALCGPRMEVPSAASGEIRLRFDHSEEIEWQVQADQPGLFVVADQFYPGWTVTVNEKPAELLRVNIVNRGVILPRGSHAVRMIYRPASLQKGASIAGTTLIVLLLAWGGRTLLARRWQWRAGSHNVN